MRSSRRLPIGSNSSSSRRDRADSLGTSAHAKRAKRPEGPAAALLPTESTHSTRSTSSHAAVAASAKAAPQKSEKEEHVEAAPEAAQPPAANGSARTTPEEISSPDTTSAAANTTKKAPREISRRRKGSINNEKLWATRADAAAPLAVIILVQGKVFTAKDAAATVSTRSSHRHSTLGNDGNQFYCQVCAEFGDVVCCDGCPKVYHPRCVPVGSPSRWAMDHDEDPWYCPDCMLLHNSNNNNNNNTAKSSNATTTTTKSDPPRRSSQHACTDCDQIVDGMPVAPCRSCGNYMHHPSCRDTTTTPGFQALLCATCTAVDALGAEEAAVDETEAPLRGDPEDDSKEDDDEELEEEGSATNVSESPLGHDSEDGGKRVSRRKRRKSSVDESVRRKSRDRKKRKKKSSSGGVSPTMETNEPPPEPMRYTMTKSSSSQIAQAIPAFYFYLGENRWKIERVLSKRSRPFNRLPKGRERNILVAKEAAIWWSKLRPADHKRYVNVSIRDFEGRVIEWKEDKSIREMNDGQEPEESSTQDEGMDYSYDSNLLTGIKHRRLFKDTAVGCKPFKAETDQHYNRVLLDLLHDIRFHPRPMLGLSLETTTEPAPPEGTSKDNADPQVVIPHFDVHGPVSASIGDECLGCLRGWAHFCPVLQRRIPAVDQRARLQPPLSSLVVTRIGLGVRQNLQTKRPPTEPDKAQDTKPRTLFEPWDTEETQKLKTLPVLQSASLGGYERMDEVVEFIEKASAMKIKEPSEIEEASTFSRRSKHQENGDARATDGVHKCGRCRTIVKGKLGCFQCRRAQLVINLAKEDKEEPGKMLRVQTAALARMDMKERSHAQTPQDQAIASAMLAERWMPCTVLEAHKVYAPSPYNPRGKRTLVREVELPDYSDSEEEEVVDEEADESPGSEEIIGRHSVTEDFHLEGDRRVRSARSAHPIAEALEPGEHQALLESNRKEVNAFHKRIVTVACCGMLHALLRRDPLMLFRNKVTVDGYTDVVKNPIDFSKIRAKILKDGYQSVAALATDVKLLCENALLYNSESTIYAKSATEMLELLATMQKSAAKWISALRDAYSRHLSQDEVRRRKMVALLEDIPPSSEDEGDPFDELREEWPEAVEMLENEAWLKAQISSDFIRTKENEIAFYGSLAVSRTAIAAEASLAPYSDSMGDFSVVGIRSHIQDAHLRDHIDRKVSEVVRAPQLKDPSTWREESVHTLLRRLQSSRVDAATASLQGCARCDGLNIGQDVRIAMKAEQALPKAKKPEDSRRVLEDKGRVDPSRFEQATGLASAERRELIGKRRQQTQEEQFDCVNDVCVSVQGSKVHGWGLYADQEFDSEDVVAEYVGEYIDNTTAEERETLYHEQRIQDYMFRVNDDQVIDATIKGGNGRYANHSCEPNCYTKTIQSKENSEWKRVMIIALRPITIHEEITYDYQFPLELDLDKRLPCNCRSESCRGFMNWDLPEKGNTRPLLVQRRGANMRDRIRRLGRPLKRDENFVTI